MPKAVLLDRDGVINEKAPEGEYVTRWEDFRFLAGAREGISKFNRAGYKVIVVSNQRCVAKGLITESELQALHQKMTSQLTAEGAVIDKIYYCPHDYPDACDCRKPAPGMLLQAASENGLNLQKTWMIGDSQSDMVAGRSAGCKTALVTQLNKSGIYADLVVDSLLEAARRIIEEREGAVGRPTNQST